MSYSGEAADQVVRLSLNGVEVAAKLSGSAAKQLAIMIYAILKDQKKTKGKIRLTNMLRSGKELKVFAVKDGDLQKFCEEAKKYGVLYCVLKDKNATDGITDIMVRAEDAAKVNRIFTRFGLATVDLASLKTELVRQQDKTRTEEDADVRSGSDKPHKVSLYAELLTTGKLNDYLADLNKQAEAMFSRLVKQLSEKEGVTEALKAENQMLWVQRMNNIRSAAMESVANNLIYC